FTVHRNHDTPLRSRNASKSTAPLHRKTAQVIRSKLACEMVEKITPQRMRGSSTITIATGLTLLSEG
ncbi:hypothetical protein, partial [Corynebacterium sp. HMSC05C01]|uniref:hypothetical protein n=1 Tax=Corynebacterium sp. HMSC05C01 TaxID=1581113 RepID=UPI001AEFF404